MAEHQPTSNGNASPLPEYSALASKYVPNNLRQANTWAVTAPFVAAVPPQDAELKCVVPHFPACYCNKKQSKTEKQQNRPHVYPFREVPVDFYKFAANYALHKPAEQRLLTFNDSISDLEHYRLVWEAILKEERLELLRRYENYSQFAVPLQISTQGENPKFLQATYSSDGGIADANPPLTIGDKVLVRPLHRVSLPLLPHQVVGPSPPPPPPPPPRVPKQPPTPDLSLMTPHQKKTYLKREQKAQRQNALQQQLYGNLVTPEEQYARQQIFAQSELLRQRERQELQLRILKNLQANAPDQTEAIHRVMYGMHWSQPIHVAEIQGTILSLHRAASGPPGSDDKSNNNDKVIFSWPDRTQSDMLLLSFKEAAKMHGNACAYNIRFIPSTTRLERCLTALDWFVEAFDDAPGLAMELLFPVSAPNVVISSADAAANDILARSYKLNSSQVNFVSMVLGRTQHPSVNEIRGPMVIYELSMLFNGSRF